MGSAVAGTKQGTYQTEEWKIQLGGLENKKAKEQKAKEQKVKEEQQEPMAGQQVAEQPPPLRPVKKLHLRKR